MGKIMYSFPRYYQNDLIRREELESSATLFSIQDFYDTIAQS